MKTSSEDQTGAGAADSPVAITTDTLPGRDRLLYDPPQLPQLATIAYSLGFAIWVPHSPGVYLIHDLRGVLYVGRTCDLNQRFHQHYWAPDNPRLSAALRVPMRDMQFSWHEVDCPAQIVLEKELIRAFYPLCNRLFYAETVAQSN